MAATLPSDLHAKLTDEHRRVRVLLDDIDALTSSPELDAEALAQRLSRLAVLLASHNANEEAALRPLLEESDSFGPQRVEQMLRDHVAEHAALRALLEPIRNLADTSELIGAARILVAALRDHLEAEEAGFLNERVLHDDLVIPDDEPGARAVPARPESTDAPAAGHRRRLRRGWGPPWRTAAPVPPIERYMTITPHTIGAEEPLDRAMEVMKTHGIRHLPVLRDTRLVGIVSDRDLQVLAAIRGLDRSDLTVADAMTSDVITVAPDVGLDKVATLMAERKAGSAVIMQDQRVVGIFTTVDGMAALATLFPSANLS